MLNYLEVLSDENILSIYKEIESVENRVLWARHGLSHINNVLQNIKRVCELFSINKELTELCLIAGVLHDLGVINGKKDHAKRSYLISKEYLKEKDLTEKQKEIILNAILNHSVIDKNSHIVNKILVFADKIDITKTRVTPYGLMQTGFKEYSKVEKIIYKIEEYAFRVEVLCFNDINMVDFEEFYFTKTFKNAVEDLSLAFNLEPIITVEPVLRNLTSI